MINDRRKTSLIFIIIFAVICCFLKWTALGKDIRDGFWGEFFPENTYVVQVEGLPTRLTSISYNVVFGRNQYKVAPVGTSINSDSILISFGEEHAEYKNSRIIATTAVKMIITDSLKKEARDNGEAETIQHSRTESTFFDSKKALEGFYNGLTWREIGYKSKNSIEILLPQDDDMLNIIIPQLYAILDNDNFVSQEDYQRLNPIVDFIIENSSRYTSDIISVSSNQIAFFVELDNDLRSHYNQFSACIVEPYKTVLYPVYANWNDSQFDNFIDGMIKNNSKNIAIKLGCRNGAGEQHNSEKLDFVSIAKTDKSINFRKD